MSLRPSPITPTVDFDRDGVQHGHLRLPWSRDDSAWGSLMIPISVIRNGAGPTALITGANHGDEYEGPLAIVELAQNLRAEAIRGRLILLPFMNHPAFLAGTRTSPIDGANMNRIFPGRPDGGVSQKIADYIHRHLLPLADVALDFHSGGKTLDFLPFAACHLLDDKALEGRCRAARDAFNAPFSIEMREIDAMGMYDETAEAMGKTFITTELGGGGTATPRTVEIARRGLRNLLIHAGILPGKIAYAPTRHLTQRGDDCFHFAEDGGLVEVCVTLGDRVHNGDLLARIWNTRHLGRAPLPVHARMDGLMTARHHPGLVQPGDCLAVLAVETEQT